MINIINFIVGALSFIVAGAPLWVTIIGAGIVVSLPIIGSVVGTDAWIWALIVTLGKPFSFWTIIVIILFLFSIISLWYPELSAWYHSRKE
jgi:hypothetical protein